MAKKFYLIKCLICGKEFQSHNRQSSFCCQDHAWQYQEKEASKKK